MHDGGIRNRGYRKYPEEGSNAAPGGKRRSDKWEPVADQVASVGPPEALDEVHGVVEGSAAHRLPDVLRVGQRVLLEFEFDGVIRENFCQ